MIHIHAENQALRSILLHTGVEVVVEYPQCCGMPQLEAGDIKDVSNRAINVSNTMKSYMDKGYDIVALTPSCALMMKQEWPNYLPNNEVQILFLFLIYRMFNCSQRRLWTPQNTL